MVYGWVFAVAACVVLVFHLNQERGKVFGVLEMEPLVATGGMGTAEKSPVRRNMFATQVNEHIRILIATENTDLMRMSTAELDDIMSLMKKPYSMYQHNVDRLQWIVNVNDVERILSEEPDVMRSVLSHFAAAHIRLEIRFVMTTENNWLLSIPSQYALRDAIGRINVFHEESRSESERFVGVHLDIDPSRCFPPATSEGQDWLYAVPVAGQELFHGDIYNDEWQSHWLELIRYSAQHLHGQSLTLGMTVDPYFIRHNRLFDAIQPNMLDYLTLRVRSTAFGSMLRGKTVGILDHLEVVQDSRTAIPINFRLDMGFDRNGGFVETGYRWMEAVTHRISAELGQSPLFGGFTLGTVQEYEALSPCGAHAQGQTACIADGDWTMPEHSVQFDSQDFDVDLLVPRMRTRAFWLWPSASFDLLYVDSTEENQFFQNLLFPHGNSELAFNRVYWNIGRDVQGVLSEHTSRIRALVRRFHLVGIYVDLVLGQRQDLSWLYNDASNQEGIDACSIAHHWIQYFEPIEAFDGIVLDIAPSSSYSVSGDTWWQRDETVQWWNALVPNKDGFNDAWQERWIHLAQSCSKSLHSVGRPVGSVFASHDLSTNTEVVQALTQYKLSDYFIVLNANNAAPQFAHVMKETLASQSLPVTFSAEMMKTGVAGTSFYAIGEESLDIVLEDVVDAFDESETLAGVAVHGINEYLLGIASRKEGLPHAQTRSMWIWPRHDWNILQLSQSALYAFVHRLSMSAWPQQTPLNRVYWNVGDITAVLGQESRVERVLQAFHHYGIRVDLAIGQRGDMTWLKSRAGAEEAIGMCRRLHAFNQKAVSHFDGVLFDIAPFSSHRVDGATWWSEEKPSEAMWWKAGIEDRFNDKWTHHWVSIFAECKEIFQETDVVVGSVFGAEDHTQLMELMHAIHSHQLLDFAVIANYYADAATSLYGSETRPNGGAVNLFDVYMIPITIMSSYRPVPSYPVHFDSESRLFEAVDRVHTFALTQPKFAGVGIHTTVPP